MINMDTFELDNSAISVKVTNVKMYAERFFFKRSNLITRPPSIKCQ